MTIASIAPIQQAQNVLLASVQLPDPRPPIALSPQTPSTKRGLLAQDHEFDFSTAIDYVSMAVPSIHIAKLKEFTRNIETICKTSFVVISDEPTRHGHCFESSWKDALGGKVLMNSQSDREDCFEVLVVLSGTHCSRAGTSAIADLITTIYMWGGYLTRIDINMDFPESWLKFVDVREAVEGDRYTRYAKAVLVKNYKKAKNDPGYTAYFGSRTGDRFVRLYHTLEKHGFLGVRYEVELKGEIARAIGKAIAKCITDEELTTILSGTLNESLRILDSEHKRNANRIATAPWWQRIASKFAACHKLRVSQKVVTLDASLRWVQKFVAKSLARLQYYYGPDFRQVLSDVLNSGFDRFTAFDYALLGAAGKDGFTRYRINDETILDLEFNPDWEFEQNPVKYPFWKRMPF